MAGSSLFINLARGAKVLALLLFLLPFVSVSCSPEALMRASRGPGAPATPDASSLPGGGRDCTLISASGLQLATANPTNSRDCVQGMGGEDAAPDTKASSGDSPFAKADYFVIGAAVLILLSLIASFLLGARGLMVGASGCLLAAGLLCYDILMRIPQAVRDSMASGPAAGGGGGPSAEQLAQMIRTKAEIGFWLVIVALLAAIVLNILAMRKPSAAVPTATV